MFLLSAVLLFYVMSSYSSHLVSAYEFTTGATSDLYRLYSVASHNKGYVDGMWAFLCLLTDVALEHLKKYFSNVRYIDHGLHEITYHIGGNEYKMIVHTQQDPSNLLMVTDGMGQDVTNKVVPYLGPNEDWHHSLFTPCALNFEQLTFQFLDGPDQTFRGAEAVEIFSKQYDTDKIHSVYTGQYIYFAYISSFEYNQVIINKFQRSETKIDPRVLEIEEIVDDISLHTTYITVNGTNYDLDTLQVYDGPLDDSKDPYNTDEIRANDNVIVNFARISDDYMIHHINLEHGMKKMMDQDVTQLAQIGPYRVYSLVSTYMDNTTESDTVGYVFYTDGNVQDGKLLIQIGEYGQYDEDDEKTQILLIRFKVLGNMYLLSQEMYQDEWDDYIILRIFELHQKDTLSLLKKMENVREQHPKMYDRHLAKSIHDYL